MDCFEQEMLNTEDTDGLELRFGNAAAMLRMVEKIAHRKGFGDILTEGSARAAARIGRESSCRCWSRAHASAFCFFR